jgi:HlyD family secretion protein
MNLKFILTEVMWRLKVVAKNNRILIGAGILLLLVMLTIVGWLIIVPAPLVVQGEVEAAEVRVASKIFGRVDSIFVKEGSSVLRGQVLISIYSPEIDAKFEQATAAQRAAGAQKDKAFIGARKEKVQGAYNMWQIAKAQSDYAEKTFQRISNLYKDGVVSAQKMDEAEAKTKASKQQTEAAQASYDMALTGARIEDKKAASALVDQASGAVSEVQAYLEETNLMAPIDGEVAEIIPNRGELISPGYPIVNIVDLDDIWVTFNLREDFLTSIKMGSRLLASIPAIGNREVELKVNYINALGSYATWSSTKTSGDFDMKTFEVRAVPVDIIEGLRPGMSAIVEWEK